MSETRRIKVKGADITGIELTMKPLISLSGSVVLEDSRVIECQDKRRPLLGEIVVGTYRNEKNTEEPPFAGTLGGPVTPETTGTFKLRNLAPGQYRFVTRPMAKYWYLKSISWPMPAPSAMAKTVVPDRPRDAARNWTTVRMGEQLTGLTITFAGGAASLRGKVDPGAGKKLPSRVFVYLAPAEPDKAEDIVRYFAAVASEDGGFALTNLPPGRYWLTVAPAGDSDSNMLSKLGLPDETELRAKLRREGESAKLQIEFKPCQNISDYRVAFK